MPLLSSRKSVSLTEAFLGEEIKMRGAPSRTIARGRACRANRVSRPSQNFVEFELQRVNMP